jgi:hypothetical protein
MPLSANEEILTLEMYKFEFVIKRFKNTTQKLTRRKYLQLA